MLIKVKHYVMKFLNKLLLEEKSCTKLTQSFCLGLFFALSPFIGLQTWLIIAFFWIFKLNIAVGIATLYTISNPFSMLPILFIEYKLGYFIINNILNLELKSNPGWLNNILYFINKYIFSIDKYLIPDLCFWCYFLGASVISITSSILIYPIMKRIFTILLSNFCKENQNENYNTK